MPGVTCSDKMSEAKGAAMLQAEPFHFMATYAWRSFANKQKAMIAAELNKTAS